jgi:hypothetical protein
MPDPDDHGAPQFQLPSQRKSAFGPTKVIGMMIVIGALIGVRTCRLQHLQQQRDEQREQHP